MILRDGRTLDESLPPLQRRWPELTKAEAEGIVSRLPRRMPRPFTASLDDVSVDVHTGSSTVEESAFMSDHLRLSRRLEDAVRRFLRELPSDERVLLRMHFEASMTIAEISRALGVDQKPLYRRIKRGLLRLRTHLKGCGFDDADAETVINLRCDLDFGFDREDEHRRPSTDREQSDGEGGGV